MAFEDITDPSAVRRAIAEFDQIGQDLFLEKYRFGASRGWMLVEDGTAYDAKAILGAAHAFQYPSLGPLPHTEFHGGQPTAQKLKALGFTVTEPTARRNPVWSRDELILALDLYMKHRPSFPDSRHPDVIDLSRLLNQLAVILTTTVENRFRNENGVAMKLQNFRRFVSSQQGKGLPAGGRGEDEVWTTFMHDPERLSATAKAIRETVLANAGDCDQSEDDDGVDAEEGKLLTRLHRTRERSKRIVERKKSAALRENGGLQCEACSFNFADKYGGRGSGFIGCHHTKPVSALLPGQKTRLDELVLLCANCHRMVHVRRPWITVGELKALFCLPAA